MDETKKRIRLSQTPTFNGKGQHMALGPSDWLHWRPGQAEKNRRTFLRTSDAASEDASQPTHVGDQENPPTGDSNDLLQQLRFMHILARNLEHSWEREAEDFAACDIECGYCGNCQY
ncbi:hypothetical protein MRB53_038315 [Persea americana]|nr:hypothetical protein MRB53_038315 [Persea americana]